MGSGALPSSRMSEGLPIEGRPSSIWPLSGPQRLCPCRAAGSLPARP